MRATRQHPDELSWKDAILGGDLEAAERFVAAHTPGLYRYVHYRLGEDSSSVEDVVQETFLVAIEKLRDFDGRASFGAWLSGIAQNRIRSRRKKRRPRPLADVLEESEADIWEVLEQVSSEPLPEWALERSETSELVGATLSALPAEYAQALVGKYVDGKSTAELAAAGSKTVKATESILGRARAAFARVFELLSARSGGGSAAQASRAPFDPERAGSDETCEESP